MAKGFDISAVFADLPVVPESGTGEQVKKISADLIDSDDRNFYELSGIDELASNILTVGLLDPIRVRQTENGRYTIVSGHRRRAAMQKLLEDGYDEFAEIPCIVDAGDMSPELQELRLIFANSDTRRMSNGDLMRQTERVQRLLYDLKEQGYEFPGRMRDYVAEACKISKTKLSNLKVIKERLGPQWMDAYKAGAISEECALQLIKSPEAIQQFIASEAMSKLKTLANIRTYQISNIQNFLTNTDNLRCEEKTGPCSHREKRLAHYCKSELSPGYHENCTSRCCSECWQLATCKDACPLLAEKVKKLKAEKAEKQKEQKDAEQERQQRQADEAKLDEALGKKLWHRISEALRISGKTAEEYLPVIEWPPYRLDMFKEHAAGEGIHSNTEPPFVESWGHTSTVRRICKAADFLGVSVDYLFCRTDEPTTPQSLRSLLWHPGPNLPDHPCMLVCKFQLQDGDVQAALCHYDGNALYVCHQDTHWTSDIVDIDPDCDSVTKSEPVSWMELEGESR